MSEEAKSPKVKIPRNSRICIRTREIPPGQRAKGQDTTVSAKFVDDQGREVEVGLSCQSVKFWVDARGGYAMAALVCNDVEMDVVAMPSTDQAEVMAAEAEYHLRLIEDLRGEIQGLRSILDELQAPSR